MTLLCDFGMTATCIQSYKRHLKIASYEWPGIVWALADCKIIIWKAQGADCNHVICRK